MAHTPNWAAFQQYIRAHHKNPKAELRWLPLLKGETVTANVRQLILWPCSSEPSLTEVGREYSLARAGLAAINLDQSFDEQKRKAYQIQLKAVFPELGAHASTAKTLCRQHPGTKFEYTPDQGYASSILFKLAQYLAFATTGVDPRELAKEAKAEKAKKKRGRDEAPQPSPPPPQPQPPQPPPPPPPPQPQPGKKQKKCPVLPPSPVQQLLRSAGLCHQLKNFLVQRKAFNRAGKRQWRAIREWTKTDDGRSWLQGAGLDPDGMHLDHIVPESRGGHDSVFNCFFMPSSLNSHFKDGETEAKREYIGRQAAKLADAYAVWHREATKEGPDQRHFHPESLMLV